MNPMGVWNPPKLIIMIPTNHKKILKTRHTEKYCIDEEFGVCRAVEALAEDEELYDPA